MGFETSNDRGAPAAGDEPLQPVKIVISGGFAVGKTTFVGSISEINPLTTEAAMTSASTGVDDTSKVQTKTHTTVAMDFGRISLGGGLVLYLFGTPGQARFQFMWDDLARGAIGAVVLVDTRRLADCFPAVDYFEQLGLPYIVAVNCFDGLQFHEQQAIREALSVPRDVPLVFCDARERTSTKESLIMLVEHALSRAE